TSFPPPCLFRTDEVEIMARGEADVRLLPVGPAAAAGAEALDLTGHARDGDPIDLDLEQQLDRPLDLGLRRVRADLEHDLVGAFGGRRGLLRNVRADDDLRQPLLMTRHAHASRPSRNLAAAAVITTRSAPTRLTGSTSLASSTSTCGRFRTDSHRFGSKPSTTITPRSTPSPASFCRASLVFGAPTVNASTRTRRSCRSSSDSTAHSAPRYILRLTFWS